MTDAFILDAVRTPRGRGRPDGSLHSITPIQLAAQALGALRDRTSLDTSQVDDVILGCVTPIGEQVVAQAERVLFYEPAARTCLPC